MPVEEKRRKGVESPQRGSFLDGDLSPRRDDEVFKMHIDGIKREENKDVFNHGADIIYGARGYGEIELLTLSGYPASIKLSSMLLCDNVD